MDNDAFDSALVELAAELPAYFCRRVASVEAVEDLTQETLLKAFRARANLREEARIRAWVYGIAHRTLVDHYRRDGPIASLCDDDLPQERATSCDDLRTVLLCSDPTLVARILKISSSYTPPPPEGFVSPMTWGIENNVIERFWRRRCSGREDLLHARHLYLQLPRRPACDSGALKKCVSDAPAISLWNTAQDRRLFFL